MRGQYRSTAAADEWTATRGAHAAPRYPQYAQGVAVAPDPTSPVTAVPGVGSAWVGPPAGGAWGGAHGGHDQVPLPATAVPATGGGGWDGWDGGNPGWDSGNQGWGAPVAYPRPPRWDGIPVEPKQSKFRLVRRVVIALLLFSMAPLLGVGALVLVFNSQSSPKDKAAGANPPQVAKPIDPSAQATASPTAPPKLLSPEQLVKAVNPTVVNITVTLGQQNVGKAGTGIVLTSDGVILTNNHVISGATSISAFDVGNGRTFKASVLGFDRSHDIAVIKLRNAGNLKTLKVCDSDNVKVGDGIMAVGNAGGEGGTPTAVTGKVTSLNQNITASEADGEGVKRLSGMIEVQADIRAGDSGGPLVDRTGCLIGVNTAASVDADDKANGGLGYAIPSNNASDIAQQIRDGKDSTTVHIGQTALLGVGASDAKSGGAQVTGTLDGGPADEAGLRTGDVITSVDGQQVDSANGLTAILDRHRPGDRVQVDWTDRNGRDRNADVELTTGPAG
jgi:S1-C subfamily serine protease